MDLTLASTQAISEVDEPYFSVANDFKFTYANPAYLKFAHTADSVVGMRFEKVHPATESAKLKEFVQRARESGQKVVESDFAALTQRWLEYRITPVGDEVRVLILDVTDQRDRDIQTGADEMRWRTILEGSKVGIAQVALDGSWLSVNTRFCEIVGLSAAELEFRSLREMCFHAGCPAVDENWTQLLAGTTDSLVSEHQIEWPNRTLVWIKLVFSLVRDLHGTPKFFVAAIDNVSERKEAEDSLSFALQAAGMGSWDYDSSANVTRRSAIFNQIFNHENSVAEWTYSHFLERILVEDRPVFESAFAQALAAGQDFSVECRIQTVDLRERWVSLLGRVYLNREGHAVRVAGLVRDITDTKVFSQELQHAKLAAEDANREKSYFLANMSHEIRTPLGAVLGFTEALCDPNLTPADRDRYLQILSRNGKAVARLIDDILDLSKVEAGFLEVEKLAVSLTESIDEVVALLRINAESKALKLEVQVTGPVPLKILVDPIRLRQVLLNIVGNAIKFTARGEVRLVLTTTSSDAGPAILIKVMDSGTGIASNARLKLFQPFSQADDSTTRVFGGTGLGLALSRRLARAMGGDLYLERSHRGWVPHLRFGCPPLSRWWNPSSKIPATCRNTLNRKIFCAAEGFCWPMTHPIIKN